MPHRCCLWHESQKHLLTWLGRQCDCLNSSTVPRLSPKTPRSKVSPSQLPQVSRTYPGAVARRPGSRRALPPCRFAGKVKRKAREAIVLQDRSPLWARSSLLLGGRVPVGYAAFGIWWVWMRWTALLGVCVHLPSFPDRHTNEAPRMKNTSLEMSFAVDLQSAILQLFFQIFVPPCVLVISPVNH